MRQRRTSLGKLGGFGHPDYTSIEVSPSQPAPAAPAPTGGWPLPAGQYFGPSNVYPSNTGVDSDAERAYVAEFQSILGGLGYDIGKYGADGEFGPATQRATLAWQRRVLATVPGQVNLAGRHITESGLCGSNDWYGIHEAVYQVRASTAAAPAVVPAFPGTMREGDKGEHVERMQAQLKVRVPSFDYSSGPGTFGPRTEAAVKAFQRSAGIVDDGIVGTTTWRVLHGG